jgi:hypothetical protein
MKRALIVFTVAILSSNAFAKGAKKNLHRPKAPATTIEAGGAAEPASPWPEITKKGHL